MNPGTRYPFLDLATVNAPYADEVAARLADVVARGRYVGGPEVDEFERGCATSPERTSP